MPKSFAGFLAQAQRDWEAGRAVDAGRVLYEHLPVSQRPAWAGRVLELVVDLVPKTPEIERVLEIAKDRARWREAYAAFQAVRRRRPESTDPLVEGVLGLAERVAKVTYIASGAPAPFERNAGWRVAGDLQVVLARAGDRGPKLREQAWGVLSGQAG